MATGLEKVSFHSNAKNCSNYRTIALISHASKVILNILHTRLQQDVNCELPDVQAGFRKGRGTRDQIDNIRWIMEKAREFQKNIYFCFIDYTKALTVWITINCGKFFKKWESTAYKSYPLFSSYMPPKSISKAQSHISPSLFFPEFHNKTFAPSFAMALSSISQLY